jgi:hypothetical protein
MTVNHTVNPCCDGQAFDLGEKGVFEIVSQSDFFPFVISIAAVQSDDGGMG